MFKKYIDIKTIDRITKINKELLDWQWFIKHINLLKKTVKIPRQYLYDNTFKKYSILPTNGIIVERFGHI